MKTAIDLADRLRDLTSKTKCPSYERGIMNGAIEMLRQQAEQIEALTKERDGAYVQSLQFSEENEALLKANLDCVDHFNTLMTDYDALKADAERYRWWVTQVEHKDFENLEKAFKSMEAREDVTKQMMDAAIDAMKGKS